VEELLVPNDDDDQSNQESNASEQSRKALGGVKQRAKFGADESGIKGLITSLKTLEGQLKSVKTKFTELVKASKDLHGTWKDLEGTGVGGGMGGTSGRTAAGGVSGNGNYLGKAGKAYGAARLGGKGLGVGLAAGAAVAGFQVGRAAWDYAGGRIEANTPYSLTADRTGLMMRQMYGGTQLDYQSRWRQPLMGGLIGRGGVEEMLKLQTTMGINPASMLSGVEGMRVASGFGYSTEDATKMISAMAQPGSSNLMTLMLGQGLYGPGGRARDPMDVIRNTVQRMGLTEQGMVEGALQPGSMTRANLSRAGLPEDMQNMVIQYAQENLNYKSRGGSGMYDPSSERHRQLMGVEDSYAMEEQRTRMSEVQRSEKFYRRQVDNFAQLEKNTQGLIEKFTQLDEVLSRLIGTKADLQNRWWLRLAGKVPGIPTLGDSEHLRDAGMNSGFAASLQEMKNAASEAGVPLTLSSGTRDDANQERLFRERHHQDDSGSIAWNGQTWTLNAGAAPAAPPGRSLHGLGYAADLGPPESYDWIVKNASRFGLRHGDSFGEPWHVAPADITSVDQVPGRASASGSSGRGRSRAVGVNAKGAASVGTLPSASKSTAGLSISDSANVYFGGVSSPKPAGDAEGYGGGSVITISPTINLTGSSSTAADADMLAKRVINLIETSNAVRSLRRS
jgi:hypothetical protein